MAQMANSATPWPKSAMEKYQWLEVHTSKRDYWNLLLLADEQEDMIERYLDKGRMFVLFDDGAKCEAVVIAKSLDTSLYSRDFFVL